MSSLPWFIGGGAVAAYLLTRPHDKRPASETEDEAELRAALAEYIRAHAKQYAPDTAASSPSGATPKGATLSALPGRWVWPLAAWLGRSPVISDGFLSPRAGYPSHGGVDLMFPRAEHDTFAVGSPNGSKLHVMPDGTQALAASDGVIWSAMKTSKGYAVVIDHAPRKVATFYTHLDQLAVPLTQPGGKNRTSVQAGQPIGTVGASPEDPEHLKHLHFEVWLGGPMARIDPARLMTTWEVPRGPLGPLVARNARARLRDARGADDLVPVVAHYRSRPGTALYRR